MPFIAAKACAVQVIVLFLTSGQSEKMVGFVRKHLK